MLSFKLWQSNQYRHRLKYKTTHQYLNYFLTSIHIKADTLRRNGWFRLVDRQRRRHRLRYRSTNKPPYF